MFHIRKNGRFYREQYQMKKIKTFDDITQAFDYCREVAKPVTVLIMDKKYRLYPSGRAEEI
jgi:hypothetical protein